MWFGDSVVYKPSANHHQRIHQFLLNISAIRRRLVLSEQSTILILGRPRFCCNCDDCWFNYIYSSWATNFFFDYFGFYSRAFPHFSTFFNYVQYCLHTIANVVMTIRFKSMFQFAIYFFSLFSKLGLLQTPHIENIYAWKLTLMRCTCFYSAVHLSSTFKFLNAYISITSLWMYLLLLSFYL